MKVAVWDTYVNRTDGKVMHFDILVPQEFIDKEKIFEYGRNYLRTKAYKTEGLSSSECQYCHIEQATQEVIDSIIDQGFYIVEMENCE